MTHLLRRVFAALLLASGARARGGFFPQSRSLEDCPPQFPAGLCNEPNAECVTACTPAFCCTNGGCLGCQECLSYAPCSILQGPPPTPPPIDSPSPSPEDGILTVDYYQGFNLHFPIEKSDAESFMPYSRFTPLKLSVEDKPLPDYAALGKASNPLQWALRTEGNSNGNYGHKKYYASFYAAIIGVKTMGIEVRVGRADLFTYAIDPDGELSQVFIAAFQEVPIPFQQDPALLEDYRSLVEGLALDSRTGQTAYPHHFVFDFQVSEDTLHISGGDITGSIDIQTGTQKCQNRQVSFPLDFVLANTFPYRSSIDKNINYFNKDFIAAKVESFWANKGNVDECLPVQNVDPLLELLPPGTSLETVQAYGNSDKAIRWLLEDSTVSSGTPFLTLAEVEDRVGFKRQIYSESWLARGAAIASGSSEMLFKLMTDKDNLFLNWEISEQGVVDLSNFLNLDSLNLELAPLSIVAGETPRYVLSLNTYVVRFEQLPPGANVGVRFEYSVYVKPPNASNNRPFFMVVEALSDVPSYDPVNGATPAVDVNHVSQDDILRVSRENNEWSAEVTFGGAQPVSVEKDWITANDVIYWSNGVADRAFFDTDLTVQKPVKATITSISGSFALSQYLKDPQEPLHALVYKRPIDFVIVPWFNLNSLLQTNPSLAELAAVKAQLYSGLAFGYAGGIAAGLQEPLVDLVVNGNPSSPKISLNFVIQEDHVKELEKAIGLPDEYKIVPMQMTASSTSKYMLTAEIFTQTLLFIDISPFNRASWTVYVENESGHTILHHFHVEYSPPLPQGIDIEEIFKPSAQVFTVTPSTSTLDIAIKSATVDANFRVPLKFMTSTERIDLADKWVHAHDKALWKKGVYDDLYYNGQLWNAQVVPIDVNEVVTSQVAPWMDFISDHPFEVFYFDADTTFVDSPWANIEEINITNQ